MRRVVVGAAEVGVAEVGVAVVRRAVVSRVSKAYLLWVYYLVLGILCLLVLGDGVVRVRGEQVEGDARPASARAPWWGRHSGGGGGGGCVWGMPLTMARPSITPLTSATILSVSCYCPHTSLVPRRCLALARETSTSSSDSIRLAGSKRFSC